MIRIILLLPAFIVSLGCLSQDVSKKLATAFTAFRQDAQLVNASSSLYVVDAVTGAVVFDYGSGVGLAPASTQKIITSVTAFELLGASFRFDTRFGYTGNVSNGTLKGDLVIRGSGDPTLGSWRYAGCTEKEVTTAVVKSIKNAGIKEMQGTVYADDHVYESATIPGGWIWDDIGNYYGAGAAGVNWRENQYDLFFDPGARIGDKPEMIKTVPALYQVTLVNELTTAAKGSGDNSYIYLAPYSAVGYLRGTVPMEKNFKISGSISDPALQTAAVFTDVLKQAGFNPGVPDSYYNPTGDKQKASAPFTLLYTQRSPSLDSVIYWLNKKSINLYAEALVKKMGEGNKDLSAPLSATNDSNTRGSTAGGIRAIKEFWKTKGVAESELELGDGSGLSPQDRVTTHAQVTILRYALGRPWYRSFLDALPEYNGMKMKSGTIRKVKGFCGYHRSAAGKQYIFSFLVNNYNGNASAVVAKMYAVLDQLK